MSHAEGEGGDDLSLSSSLDRKALQQFPPGAPPLSPYNSLDSGTSLGKGQDGAVANRDGGGSREPKDHYNTVFFIMVLQGVSVLLNWNTMITAYDYFHLAMDSDQFEFYFTLIFNIPCFLTNLAMIQWGTKVPLTLRILVGQVAFLVILIALPIIGSARFTGKLAQGTTNTLIYLMCGCTGLTTGMLFPSMTGLAAIFPSRYMTAAMSGVGFGGVIVGVIRIATRAALPVDDKGVRQGSRIYFAVGASTMLLAIVSFFLMKRLPFAQHYLQRSDKAQRGSTEPTARRLLDGPVPGSDGLSAAAGNGDNDGIDADVSTVSIGGKPLGGGAGDDSLLSSTASSDPAAVSLGTNARPTFRSVFAKTWVVQASIYVAFAVTIGLFPGVSTLIDSEDPDFSVWFKIILISLFLLFDWIGRSLPNLFMLFNHRNVWIPSLMRLVFVPLFIFCVKPRLFHNDAFPYAIMIAFALSNGYLCTSLMTFSPQLVDTSEMELVGIMTVFFLNGGILTGAGIGMLLSHVL